MRRALVLLFAMLCLGAVTAVRAWRSSGLTEPPVHEAQDVQIVEVSAERFSFTPSEVRTKVGARVEFKVRSDDTDHGFRILGTDINVRIPKRGQGVVTVPFQPAKAGRYTFECSKLCGAGHSFMRGAIVVSQ